jgi:hypothetical protein
MAGRGRLSVGIIGGASISAGKLIEILLDLTEPKFAGAPATPRRANR